MNIKFILLILPLFGLLSCNNTTQYGIRVENSTGETIRVEFKSSNNINGILESSITLEEGSHQVIINTGDVYNGKDNLCQYVAEYVDAYIRNEIKSNIEWCGDEVKLTWEDFGQKVYVINYTLSDFEI